MSGLQKWLEWLKDDPLTALTCYKAVGLTWSEAWNFLSRRYLPDSENPERLFEFDYQYFEELAEYGCYGIFIGDAYSLVMDYVEDKVILYDARNEKPTWSEYDKLLEFDRPQDLLPHEVLGQALKEIEPYMYNLLFKSAVQTTEDEA